MSRRLSGRVLVSVALAATMLPLATSSASANNPARVPADRSSMGAPATGLPPTTPETSGQLWVARYNGHANGADDASAVRLSGDGTHIYVTGSSWGGLPSDGGSGTDYATIAYDTSGHTLWARRYNGSGDRADKATAEAVGPSRIYVTGWSEGSGSGKDFETLAYTSSGALLWAERYNGPANGDDEATTIAASPDGSKVFVSGMATGAGGIGVYETIAYNSDGTELWSASLGSSIDGPSYLAASPDGTRVYVTGGSSSNTFVTAAYDASTGKETWTATSKRPLRLPSLCYCFLSLPLLERFLSAWCCPSSPCRSTSNN